MAMMAITTKSSMRVKAQLGAWPLGQLRPGAPVPGKGSFFMAQDELKIGP
jgi:hypothetical protein